MGLHLCRQTDIYLQEYNECRRDVVVTQETTTSAVCALSWRHGHLLMT